MLKFKKTFVRVFAFNLLGVLLGPMIFFVPSVTEAGGTFTTNQVHFRFKGDTGGETATDWLAAEDVNVGSMGPSTNFRLRIHFDESGNVTGSVTPRIEYKAAAGGACTDASGWTTITTSISNAIALSSSTNFSDGAPTTEQLASKGGVTFIAGELLESSNPGSEIFIGPKKETEYEWNLVVTAAATPGTAYILRVSNNGTNLTNYNVCPQVTTNAAPSTPTQDSPSNNAIDLSTTPTFTMTSTDSNSDNLGYKVTIYSNSGCSAVVQTNDQAVSSTGWSGQNTSCTNNPTSCFTSGTQGTYVTQTPLSAGTDYWWKASAKDPDGSATFTDSSTCNKFSTEAAPVVSGTIFNDEGVTQDTTGGRILKLRVATGTPGIFSTTTYANTGEWRITSITSLPQGISLSAWIDGDSGFRAFSHTKSSTTKSIYNFDLYKDTIIVKHEGGPASTSTTNADLGLYDGDNTTNGSIRFTSNSNNLFVFSGNKLLIATSTYYRPGGTITIAGNGPSGGANDGDLYIASGARLDLGGEMTIAGDLRTHQYGFLTSPGYGVLFNATTTGKTIDLFSGSSFASTTFSGVGSAWSFTRSAATTTGNFTISAGTVTAPSSYLDIGGSFHNAGTFTNNGTTITFAGVTTTAITGTLTNGNGLGSVRFQSGFKASKVGGEGVNSSWTTAEAIYSMTAHQNKLYIGMGYDAGEAEVWEYNGSTWTKIGDSTEWGVATYEYIFSLTSHNGKLYAGVSGTTAGEAEVWEYNGSTWTQIGGDGTNSSWNTDYEIVESMVSHDGKLYAGIGSTAGDGEVWEYSGSTWTKIGGDNMGWDGTNYERVYSLASFGGKLYAGLGLSAGEAEVWEYNGASWTKVGGDGTGWADATYESVLALEAHNNKLYAGLGTTAGEAEVWEYNGASWTKIADSPQWGVASYEAVYSLSSHGGKLYAGLGSSAGDGDLWMYDGSLWMKVAGDFINSSWDPSVFDLIYALTSNNGRLYAGLGYTAINKGAVWEIGMLPSGAMPTSTSMNITSFFPILGNASTTNFTIVDASTTVALPSSLSISGNYSNSGVLKAGFGTTTFTGTSAQTLSGTLTNGGSFNDLEFFGAGMKTFSANASTTGNFQILAGSGTVVAPSVLTVNGNFANGASFNHNNGTLFMTGATTTLSGILTGSSALNNVEFKTGVQAWKVGGDGAGWNGTDYEYARSFASHNNKLYAGLGTTAGEAEVWEYNGSVWTKIADDTEWGAATYDMVISLTSHNNKLYAGLGIHSGEAEVWEYNGSTWTLVGGDAVNSSWADATYEYAWSLVSHNNKLYAGLGWSAGEAEVWEYNGSSWTKIADDTEWGAATYEVVNSLTSHNNKLYAGLGLTAGAAEVWEYNGSTWTLVGGDAVNSSWADATYEYVRSFASHNNKLYAGLGISAGEAEVWEYNGSVWTKIADDTEWGAATYEMVYSLTSHNNKLYAGLGNTAGDAEVWEVGSLPGTTTIASTASTTDFIIGRATTTAGYATTTIVAPSTMLTIAGDYTNSSSGFFTHNSGTVYFDATSTAAQPTQTLSGLMYGSTNAFNNVIFTGTGTTTFASNASTTNFTIEAGDTFIKLPNPDLPVALTNGAAFSPDGVYLAVAVNASPYVTIYKRSGDAFVKLSNPGTLPTGAARAVAFSSDGTYLSVAHFTSPFVTIYKRSGDTFTKLANPSLLPPDTGRGIAFSPSGEYLVVGHSTTPFVTIYKRAGDTFRKLANPDTMPTGAGYGVSFSSDNSYLAVSHDTTPYVTVYKRAGDTFMKLDNPSDLPSSNGRAATFSNSGLYLAVGHNSSPYVTMYKRSGDTFSKLASPFSSSPSTSITNGVAFSPDDKYFIWAHASTPYVSLYRRSGDSFGRLTNPANLPTGDGYYGPVFSSDGTYLAIPHNNSPYITLYKHSPVVNLPTDSLTISGNLTNYGGTFDWRSGTTYMDSASSQQIDGVFRGPSNLGNLILTGGGGKSMPGNVASTTVEIHDLTINSGNTLTSSPYNLGIYGNFANSGTFTNNGGTTTFSVSEPGTQYISGNLTGTSALGNIHHDSATTTSSEAVFNFIDPVDVSPTSYAAWTDVDVSSYIPEGATGVILHISTASNDAFGVRKNGSTDARYRYGYGGQHLWAMIGVDVNRIFEADIANSGVAIWLVGYTTAGATFFTNAVDKSLAGTGAWTDIDISTDTGSDTAIGAIIEYHDVGGTGDFGLRKNGSTDNRVRRNLGHAWAVVGVDASEILEGYITDAGNDFYLVGYITAGAVFKTNADDISLGSTGAYATIDLSSYIGTDTMTGAFIETYSAVAGGGNNYAFRTMGSSEDIYRKSYEHAWAIVETDANNQIEGKISSTNEDFFLVGYATSTITEVPSVIYSNNASTTNFVVSRGQIQLPSLFSISGFASSSGEMVSGSGTVYLNGSSLQTWFSSSTGSSAFNNLVILNTSGIDAQTSPSVIFREPITVAGTFTATQPNTKIQFAAGAAATTSIGNLVLNGGAIETRVTLRSYISGTQFGLNVSGTRSVLNTNVKDSNACGDYSAIDASDSSNYDGTGNTCWTFPVSGNLSLLTVSNQIFEYGQSSASTTLTVTDAATPSITTANGLRIAIATSSVNMRFDSNYLSAIFGGSASGKVGSNLSLEGDGSVLYIPVTENFGGSNVLTIAGIKLGSFASGTAAFEGALNIFKDGVTDQTSDASDTKTVTIKGLLVVTPADGGKATNMLDTTGTTVNAAKLFTFKLNPQGEHAIISSLAISITDVRVTEEGDITSPTLYIDYDGDGVVDAGDSEVGGTGVVSITSRTGTITFSSSFTATTTRNYIMKATVNNLGNANEINLALRSDGITATGAVSTLPLRVTGNAPQTNHRKLTVVSTGGGTPAQTIGGQEAQSAGQVGNNDGDLDSGEEIGSEGGFIAPTALGATFSEWTNASDALASDNIYATETTLYGRQDYSTFGFSIPAGNTIIGIEVKIEAKASSAAGTIGAALSSDSGSSTTTPDKVTSTLSTTDVVYTLGGPADLWGRAWDSTHFGTTFRLRIIANVSSNTISVDAIQVKVYHQATGGSSGGGTEAFNPTKIHLLTSVWQQVTSSIKQQLSASFLNF